MTLEEMIIRLEVLVSVLSAKGLFDDEECEKFYQQHSQHRRCSVEQILESVKQCVEEFAKK